MSVQFYDRDHNFGEFRPEILSACYCLRERAQPGGPLADCGFGLETGSQVYAVASRIPDPHPSDRKRRSSPSTRTWRARKLHRWSWAGQAKMPPSRERSVYCRSLKRAAKNPELIQRARKLLDSYDRYQDGTKCISVGRHSHIYFREAKPAPHSASTGRKCVFLTRF